VATSKQQAAPAAEAMAWLCSGYRVMSVKSRAGKSQRQLKNLRDLSRSRESDPLEPQRSELAAAIDRLTPTDGKHSTAVPGLSLLRHSLSVEPDCGVYKAHLVLAAQGKKRVVLAGRAYEYGHTHGLITSVDLPLLAQVVAATPDAPYLCAVYELNLQRLADLMSDTRLPEPSRVPDGKAISVCTLSAPLLDVMLRLVRLVDAPEDIPFLAPLIEGELLYRLLISEQGTRLRQLTLSDSQSYKIAKAIAWLRAQYTTPLHIDSLAQHVNMSVSSLHHHFKAITSMSPLQYQKQLRLHESRRLMVKLGFDATTAAQTVGYGSASQFSREYSRLFGMPPTRDVNRFRMNVWQESESS
jgi:AraC-like DNA-binding protein